MHYQCSDLGTYDINLFHVVFFVFFARAACSVLWVLQHPFSWGVHVIWLSCIREAYVWRSTPDGADM